MLKRKRLNGRRRRRSAFKHKAVAPYAHVEHGEEENKISIEEGEKKPEVAKADVNLASSSKPLPTKGEKALKQFKDHNSKPDGLLENAYEIVDVTGVSSWDDAYRAYNKPKWGFGEYVDMFSAAPLVGNLGKAAKGGFNLYKNAVGVGSTVLGGVARGQKALNAVDGVGDIATDNAEKPKVLYSKDGIAR